VHRALPGRRQSGWKGRLDGYIKRLDGIYELQDMDPTQHDQNFVHATLRLNLAEMQRRAPEYQDNDLRRAHLR
jgi:hypothetical protein